MGKVGCAAVSQARVVLGGVRVERALIWRGRLAVLCDANAIVEATSGRRAREWNFPVSSVHGNLYMRVASLWCEAIETVCGAIVLL
jgi:hypothetical protein